MAETQDIINKLYALRAGMSVLSMQYDEYGNTFYEIEKICARAGKHVKKLINKDLQEIDKDLAFLEQPDDFSYDSSYRSDKAFVDITSGGNISISSEQRGMCRLAYEKYPNDATAPYYWIELILQSCYFDLNEYSMLYNLPSVKERVAAQARFREKHYNQLTRLTKQYRIDFSVFHSAYYEKDDYMDWQNLFADDSFNQQSARDCVDKMVCELNTNFRPFWQAKQITDNIIGGHWLLTDEALKHFKTKIKELHELVDTIHGFNAQLQPKGFFGKLINKNKDEIAKNDTRLRLGTIAIRNAENSIKYIETSQIKSIVEEKNKKMDGIKSSYNQIYRALQDEYSALLDVRDWESIDLVIYFMETRRADTIKEALQQVDMEKRTDRIVSTIREATDRICSTIAIGFAALNASMRQCFAVIESRIAEQNALLSQQNSALAELTSATNMNNALVAKQKTTSEKLMKDIKSLKAAVSA